MVLERSEVAGHSWHGHLLLLHGSEGERESGLVSWVRRGLANNEKVIYSEAPAEPEARSVAAILRRHGIDAAGSGRKSGSRRCRSLVLVLRPQAPPAWRPCAGWPSGWSSGARRGIPRGQDHRQGHRRADILDWPGYTDVKRETDTICRARPLSVPVPAGRRERCPAV